MCRGGGGIRDGQGSRGYGEVCERRDRVSKMMPFDSDMLGSREIFGVWVGNLKGALIIFVDVRLQLFRDHVTAGAADTSG